MEQPIQSLESFEPEVYCLVCRRMDWDEENRRCANFDGPDCPLTIRRVLADIEMKCMVI